MASVNLLKSRGLTHSPPWFRNKRTLIFSTGTAAVRGVQPLAPNMHHYWEVRMESTLYGTDVSVGVGTQNACYDSHESSFIKLLGKDRYSWG